MEDKTLPQTNTSQDAAPESGPPSAARGSSSSTTRNGDNSSGSNLGRRFWLLRSLLNGALVVVTAAAVLALVGVAQRAGWITGGGSGAGRGAAAASNVQYICPMMCTPPQAEPGRCPVCAMELVPSTSGGMQPSRSIHIDPASRRVANIQTASVTSMPITRTIRAIGELNYDEGSLRTIAAYVEGRLDRLYADYTGIMVAKGDNLALLYSPQLYSGQVELLVAKKAQNEQQPAAGSRLLPSSVDFYNSAKERLILLGMTAQQIEQLEKAGVATSRMHVSAPISGTVIEKLAVEGQYVKEGDAIYKLADLSSVWLMLRLFPEDAATIRYGQKITAEVQSLPGREFAGRVAFVDRSVDAKTRTVGVRVVIPNADGLLRIGDYAKATIDVPLSDAQQTLAYDPELANKWISPRHPHVIAVEAGACPICGVDLVPASQFGFSDQPSVVTEALVVPRDAVLMAGNKSVLYVETKPGHFEIRQVVLGPSVGDQMVIQQGVAMGEQVATRGNFLIDSQMQLAGNPSLIDPTKLDGIIAEPKQPAPLTPTPKMIAAFATLSPEDRAMAERQGFCPVAQYPLGAMGTPKKVDVKGTPVFICCDDCRKRLLAEPDKYLAKIASKPKTAPTQKPPTETRPRLKVPPVDVPRKAVPNQPEPPAFFESADNPSVEPKTNRAAQSAQEGLR